jgi:hypothetical protein
MATGLVQLAWLLHGLNTGSRARVTTQPSRWTQTTPLLLWEAFVSDRAETTADPDAHLDDLRAVTAGA